MVTLTLRVERLPQGPTLHFHQVEVDAQVVRGDLEAIDDGAFLEVDCEYVAGTGLVAVRVLAMTTHSMPAPRTTLRALIEKGDHQGALSTLERLGDQRVLTDPPLLLARAAARIGAGDEAGAAADLRQLLVTPGVTSLDVRDVFEQYGARFTATGPLAEDLFAWLEAKKPARVTGYLTGVPPKLWPIDLLLVGLEDAITASVPDRARVIALLDAARSTAPDHARVRALWSLAASKGLTQNRSAPP